MKPDKALAAAAAAGDLTTMRAMLEEDNTLAANWKPIMDACYVGQADAVALLLEHGADPNVKSKSAHHYRPLHRTVEYKKTAPKHDGHHQVVKLLLDAGADPLMQGSYTFISAIAVCATGDTPEFLPALLDSAPAQHDIFHAAVLGDAARVEALLKADPSLAKAHHEGTKIWTSDKGWTPLTYCVSSRVGTDSEKKRKALAQIAGSLIDHGADLTGCVDQAIYRDNSEVFEMLLKAGGRCADDDTLNHAACDGHFDALELLLKYGAALDGTRGTDHHGGYTPLGCTVSCRSIQGARWFLEKGQDPNNIKSKEGENCLHVAVHFGASDKMLQLLLDYGAKIDQKDKQGRTPLTRAREKKHKKAIKLLGSRRRNGIGSAEALDIFPS